MFLLLALAALAADPIDSTPARATFHVLSPVPSNDRGLVVPPRLALGLGYAFGPWAPTSGLQFRARPVHAVPIELELALGGGFSSTSGPHVGGAAGLLTRPILFTSRDVWTGFELGGGIGASSFREQTFSPYLRTGLGLGFAPAWAPNLHLGATWVPGTTPSPSAALSWEIGRRKTP